MLRFAKRFWLQKMTSRFAACLAIGCGWTAAVPATATDRLSLSPWPNKVLYDPGEAAKFEITITNKTQGRLSGKLIVSAVWEMEDSKRLAEQALELSPGEEKRVQAMWANLPEVLGCEVRADLLGADGTLAATGSEYFNVCRSQDACRVGIHAVGAGLMTYSDQTFLDSIPKTIAVNRAGYVNIGEYFAGRSAVLNLAPEGEEWPGGDYWNSKKALRLAISEGHRCGQKAVVYATSYTTHGLDDLDIPLRHPEWLAYNTQGQPYASVNVQREDKHRFPEKGMLPQPGPFNSAILNWMNSELLDYHIGQLISNKKMFDMDGVRYDGEPGSQWGEFDVQGKPLPKGEGRAKERVRIINYIRRRVSKVFPDYLFMFNVGTAVGVGNPVDLKHGVLDPQLIPIVAKGGALCDEEMREAYSAYNPFHEWRKFAQGVVSDVDLTRKGGGYAYVLFPWTSTVHRNADELGYSILLAAGDHPWFAGPGDYKLDPGGSHYPIQKELFAFATRFSAMLWGHGIHRVRDPENLIEVQSDKGEIWWREFVHQRVLPDGRQYLIVHLVNAPPTKDIGATDQPLPEPIDNVRVRLKVPIKKVWSATARPGPPRKVTAPPGNRPWYTSDSWEELGPMKYGPVTCEKGEVVVPQLRVWTMVVAELRG